MKIHLVLFASDNGNTDGNAREGEIPTSQFFENDSPRAGRKGDILDGAFHVPAIARWTKHIAPGQESDHIWAMWDFLPTVADLVGVSPPDHIGWNLNPSNTDGRKRKAEEARFSLLGISRKNRQLGWPIGMDIKIRRAN